MSGRVALGLSLIYGIQRLRQTDLFDWDDDEDEQ